MCAAIVGNITPDEARSYRTVGLRDANGQQNGCQDGDWNAAFFIRIDGICITRLNERS
jgi:hypothetical protein